MRTHHEEQAEVHALEGQNLVTLIALLAWAEQHEETMGHHEQLERHRNLIQAMGLADEVAHLRRLVEGRQPSPATLPPARMGGKLWS